jgi:hypothetical protein
VTPRTTEQKVIAKMSSRLGLGNLSSVQEALVLALMLVSVFALFFSNIDLTYKIGIVALAFTIIFLTSLASQLLKQEEEQNQHRHNA